MKKFILKIVIIILFFVGIFIFNTDSFAALGTHNVDTSTFSSSTVSYISKCTNLVFNFAKENNIQYDYYFIITHSGMSTNLNNEETIFKILLTGSDIGFSTRYGGCLSASSSAYCFDFETFSYDYVGGTPFTPNAAFDNLRVFYTNYNYGGSIIANEILSITPSFDIELSTIEDTTNPITAYSNYFNYEDAAKYECYISTDSTNWTLMNYETLTNDGVTTFRFNYVILENMTYYFKFLNKETQEEYYISKSITNILKNSSNSGFTSKGVPQPFVNYERVGEYFIIKTQSFTKDEILKYKCLYTNSFTEDYSTWPEMSIGSFKNTQLGQTEYYFFISVPKDSENCTYYFVFYDYNKQEYGDFSSLDCDFEKMNIYSDEVAGIIEEKKTRFNELLDFFKERFGFLTYPFEFISDLLNRILNIDYKEPIIRIPEMYSPIDNTKIYDGYEYNFNDLLNNDAISNIYNIYLIAVDFIIVIGVVVLAKNTIMEVFGNG